MSSPLNTILIGDYTSIAIFSIVVYDYVLTFSREITYVWGRPWTRVSTLFVVVRYLGLCWAITLALVGSAFLPGPVNEYYFKGIVMLLVGDWAYVLFLAAADLVMVLRVYAIWIRSRKILGILLFIYVPQVIVSFVWNGIYDNPNKTFSVMVIQDLDFTYCSYSFNMTSSLTIYRAIPRFVLGATLLILAVFPTLKQSVEMYRLSRRWQTSRSMKLLAREGAVYFVLSLLFNILTVIQPGYPLPTDFMVFLVTLSYAGSCVIMPRFIISIRELYDRDLWNRSQGIDTGFGLFSQPSVITFADVSLEEGQAAEGNADDSEAIRLEVVGDGARRV